MHFLWRICTIAFILDVFLTTTLAFELIRDEHGLLDSVDDDVPDISDRYIVILQPHADLLTHVESVQNRLSSISDKDSRYNYEGITHEFKIDRFKAYAGHFDPDFASSLKQHEDVLFVEEDQVWTISGCKTPDGQAPVCPGKMKDNDLWESTPLTPPLTPPSKHPDSKVQLNAPRHLSLISHRHMHPGTEDENYIYHPSATALFAYVVDTGIMINHAQFVPRAIHGYNAAKTLPFDDLVGHGTHVAGLIGGKTYGAAKNATLIDVKVFERSSGTTSAVLDGFHWAVAQINLHDAAEQSVINMSLGGCFSCGINSAIEAAEGKGISVVAAAGNSATRARYTRSAIVAGATDMTRRRAPFSNWGRRVSIFAPGVEVTSAWIGSEDATMNVSGTSQAAPLVAGVLLYLKGLGNLGDAQKAKEMLLALATRDAVKNLFFSPNLFLYNGSGR